MFLVFIVAPLTVIPNFIALSMCSRADCVSEGAAAVKSSSLA